MIAIIMIVLALGIPLAMARRGKGRRPMGKYVRGSVDDTVSLPTLGASTAVSEVMSGLVNERTLVSSIVAAYSMDNFTQDTADGPIAVGVAHSDYTDAEIEAYIENTGSWNEGDKVSQEIGKRQIRRIGIFTGNISAAVDSVVLNDGKLIKTKLNWILLQGQGLRLWAYNMGSSALATTIPVVHAQGHVNLWPR